MSYRIKCDSCLGYTTEADEGLIRCFDPRDRCNASEQVYGFDLIDTGEGYTIECACGCKEVSVTEGYELECPLCSELFWLSEFTLEAV